MTYIYFPSFPYLIRITFLFTMQGADTGEPKTDLEVWQKTKEKNPDLEKPQPQRPEYFGSSQEDLQAYCKTVKAFHPEVDDPLSEEVDERSVYIYIYMEQRAFIFTACFYLV